VGRQRNHLKYEVVGHVSGESGSRNMGTMRRTVTTPPSEGVAVPAAQSQGGGPARVWRAGQDG